ncbi:MAG: DUF2284 domain-containing protein [Proteobacteria bacterium]|nr:DUF2284 domain-containing protein [Pseudomonadota bacterium]
MIKKIKYEIFTKKAVVLGAKEAKIIDAKTIITAAWVRMKCQFGCDGYGSNLCCPPYTPKPEETRKVIDCYKKAILIHNTNKGSITKTIVKLEREIFLSGYYKALGFGAGPCRLCKDCSLDNCRHTEKTRPSMESCGIDVYETARRNGYPIEVVKNTKCKDNYYGIVLIE